MSGEVLRILVVDDSEDDTLLVARALRRDGIEPVVTRVETQEAMVATLEEGPADVVLCDYNLPYFSMSEALAVTREYLPGVPFIIVSGTIGDEAAVAAMKSGVNDYVLKHNLERLSTSVRKELEEAEVRQAKARAEEALRQSFAELRERDEERRTLLSRLVRAQDEERRRIADGIHDDPLQVITAIKLRLERLREQTDGEHAAMLYQIDELIGGVMTRLRHLLFELHPPALEQKGLAPALRTLLEQTEENGGPSPNLDDRMTVQPPLDARTTLYRIVQEALSNVRKHAQATHVRVALADRDGWFVARVEDDGVGFVVQERAGMAGHLGLAGMRERALMHGGSCQVLSAPGSGTTVECRIPVSAGAASGNGAGERDQT